MGLSEFARKRALSVIFGGDLAVGLARSGNEIDDKGYERRSVRFQAQASVTVASATDVRFGPWQETAPLVNGWLVFDDAGRELASGDLEEREAGGEIGRGDEIVLRAGNLVAGLENEKNGQA